MVVVVMMMMVVCGSSSSSSSSTGSSSNLCYFTEFGKPVFQHITASIFMHESTVFCSACTMLS